MDFGVGEQPSAPPGETVANLFELIVKRLERLTVPRGLAPSIGYHLIEPRRGDPKVLKLEGSPPPQSNGVFKQQGQWSESEECRACKMCVLN